MSDDRKYLKNASRMLVYALLALSVFFGLAVFVFVLRGQDIETQNMPDLVGKYYVDVHNDLQRLQLRVEIEKKYYPDQGSGVILYQSLPSGRSVLAKEKLNLVVNQPEPVLLMPDYKRTAFAAAQAGLQKIIYEERIYEVEIGAVTEIQTDEYPDGTIIDQFPEAGVQLSRAQKAYFLVARKTAASEQKVFDIKSLIGQNVSIATSRLARQGLDYRIVEAKQTRDSHLDGIIYDIAQTNPVEIKIHHLKTKTNFRNGSELVEVELSETGRCIAQVTHMGTGDETLLNESRDVFVTQNHKPDELVKVYFFRQGSSKLDVKCQDESIYTKTFQPDDLG